MEYETRKPIYLQIADYVYENIITGVWHEDDRIPSIREMAVEAEVNPNTITRTFSHLQDQGVIYNQRGIGYFISEGAEQKTRELLRREFVETELPHLFKRISLLGLDWSELEPLYEQWKAGEEEAS